MLNLSILENYDFLQRSVTPTEVPPIMFFIHPNDCLLHTWRWALIFKSFGRARLYNTTGMKRWLQLNDDVSNPSFPLDPVLWLLGHVEGVVPAKYTWLFVFYFAYYTSSLALQIFSSNSGWQYMTSAAPKSQVLLNTTPHPPMVWRWGERRVR